jgi:hypothetical protein
MRHELRSMPLDQPSSVAIHEENVAGRKMRGVDRHHLENAIADSSILEKWPQGISSPKLLQTLTGCVKIRSLRTFVSASRESTRSSFLCVAKRHTQFPGSAPAQYTRINFEKPFVGGAVLRAGRFDPASCSVLLSSLQDSCVIPYG